MVEHWFRLLLNCTRDTNEVKDRYMFGERWERHLCVNICLLLSIANMRTSSDTISSAQFTDAESREENTDTAFLHSGITVRGIRSIKFVALEDKLVLYDRNLECKTYQLPAHWMVG